MTNFNMKTLVACLIAANANGIYASESLDPTTSTTVSAAPTASTADASTQTDPDPRLEQLQKDLTRAQGAADFYKAESATAAASADHYAKQFTTLHMEKNKLAETLKAAEEARDRNDMRYQDAFLENWKLKAELSELRAKFALAGIPSSATTTSSKD